MLSPLANDVYHVESFASDRPVGLFIELPHGATKTQHFQKYQRNLHGSLPKDLIHFFYVNTDVGTYEAAQYIAQSYCDRQQSKGAVILRSLIPRTFIDCNRLIDIDPNQYKEAGVTPGIPSYITHPEDKDFLLEQYRCYQAQAHTLFENICGAGGFAIMLHSYGPKTVGIQKVEDDIVERLHWAYEPENFKTWPLRPPVDIICKTKTGDWFADVEKIQRIEETYQSHNIDIAISQTYPMHPATTAYHHAKRYPGQTLCIEFRRDLIMQSFKPFEEMVADDRKIKKMTEPLLSVLCPTPC